MRNTDKGVLLSIYSYRQETLESRDFVLCKNGYYLGPIYIVANSGKNVKLLQEVVAL